MNNKKKKFQKDNNSIQTFILNKENVTLCDVMCPICLTILIEPVTMPCNHSLCLKCFRENISQTSLNCPICRKRISIWVRKYPNYENLVDKDLWSLIKDKFPNKVKASIENSEDSQEYIPAASLKIASPGEIRREYEKELQSVNAEIAILKQKENDASVKVITEIVEEENIHMEMTKRKNNDICKLDLQLAKEIRQKQISEKISSMKSISKLFSPIAKCRLTTLDKYFEKSPKNIGKTETFKRTSTPKGSKSNDSIAWLPRDSKLSYRNESESDLDDSPIFNTSIRKPLRENETNNNNDSNDSLLNNAVNDGEGLNFSGFLEENSKPHVTQSTTALSLYLSTSNEAPSLMGMSMESNRALQNCSNLSNISNQECKMISAIKDSNDSTMVGVSDVFQNLNMTEVELKEMVAEQKSFDDRKLQENADRRLAFQLQKELKFVNRRKGTENEYGLRKTTPNGKGRIQSRKRNRSLNQPTIINSFAKRRKPS